METRITVSPDRRSGAAEHWLCVWLLTGAQSRSAPQRTLQANLALDPRGVRRPIQRIPCRRAEEHEQEQVNLLDTRTGSAIYGPLKTELEKRYPGVK